MSDDDINELAAAISLCCSSMGNAKWGLQLWLTRLAVSINSVDKDTFILFRDGRDLEWYVIKAYATHPTMLRLFERLGIEPTPLAHTPLAKGTPYQTKWYDAVKDHEAD